MKKHTLNIKGSQLSEIFDTEKIINESSMKKSDFEVGLSENKIGVEYRTDFNTPDLFKKMKNIFKKVWI